VRIAQGYLSTTPDSTVRVRLSGNDAWLTIKGRSTGATRLEFEYPVPVGDAQQLLALCQAGRIDKTRHKVPVGKHVWDVDVFHGDNDGLVVAEVELGDEGEDFVRPAWLGDEVTDDPRYFNSALSELPFSRWPGRT
jgi:CYTH domain-containing protein